MSHQLCEHGMSAELCAGPQHYPADDQFYDHMSTSELMSATSSSYHARGKDCPWDCGRCPGNIAADEAEREYYDSLVSLVKVPAAPWGVWSSYEGEEVPF